jgi:hypothetical protein
MLRHRRRQLPSIAYSSAWEPQISPFQTLPKLQNYWKCFYCSHTARFYMKVLIVRVTLFHSMTLNDKRIMKNAGQQFWRSSAKEQVLRRVSLRVTSMIIGPTICWVKQQPCLLIHTETAIISDKWTIGNLQHSRIYFVPRIPNNNFSFPSHK